MVVNDIDMALEQVDELISADHSLPAYPEANTALGRLTHKSDLYVLSMGSPSMIEQSQKNAGIDHHFKDILTTLDRQIYKPGRPAYELGVELIGQARDQIAFISGNSFDVIGSKNFGFPTRWIRRYDQPLDDLGLESDQVVKDPKEIADALGV